MSLLSEQDSNTLLGRLLNWTLFYWLITLLMLSTLYKKLFFLIFYAGGFNLDNGILVFFLYSLLNSETSTVYSISFQIFLELLSIYCYGISVFIPAGVEAFVDVVKFYLTTFFSSNYLLISIYFYFGCGWRLLENLTHFCGILMLFFRTLSIYLYFNFLGSLILCLRSLT